MKFPASCFGKVSCLVFLIIALLTVMPGSSVQASVPVRLDLDKKTGRSDTRTAGWTQWPIEEGQEAALAIASLRVSLRAGGDASLRGVWRKASLATGATMAADGVSLEDGEGPAQLHLEISGLTPGRHSLTTYHNLLDRENPAQLTIAAASSQPAATVLPTYRSTDNEDAASAYLEFDADENGRMAISITGPTPGQVVLNGLVIDGADPQRQARQPWPADRDWHADADAGRLTLRWTPAATAVEHRVYLATGPSSEEVVETVGKEGTESAAYLGATADDRSTAVVDPAQTLRHYAWRVDTVDAAGNVVRGDVWQFRPRRLAFPQAEGYGRFAIGGRGGTIYKVTNLDDSGPGSLRAAVEAEGPRIVLFDIGGRIQLKSRLVVRNPYLTIAGQTAPGKGICISNYNVGMLGTHDNVIRFIRVRPGDVEGVTLDGMGMASTDHSIIDHCSISWTQDEAFSSRGADNITLQRTLISEALNVAGHKKYKKGAEHGYAASIGGDIGSFHHNLLAHCAGRNWSLAGGVDAASVHAGRLDIRNNVVYNWRHRTTDGGAKEVNFVNNYYRPGPASRVFHVLKPQHELPFGPQEYYVRGNVMEGRYDADEPYAGLAESPDKPRSEYLVEEPFFPPRVTTSSAAEALTDVLADVGCNRPMLDEHDRRVLEEVRNKTTTYRGSVTGYPGLPDSQEDVGGWEVYPEVRRDRTWDSDNDGLPDWWEARTGLNPNSPKDDRGDPHDDSDGDGYTNIEEYLHWMAEPGNEVPR